MYVADTVHSETTNKTKFIRDYFSRSRRQRTLFGAPIDVYAHLETTPFSDNKIVATEIRTFFR